MQKDPQDRHLLIDLDAKNCRLSAGETDKMEAALEPLARVAANFPVSKLHIYVHRHMRTRDYHVKTSLTLSGRTLFTGERDVAAYPAFERCVSKLVNKVNSYKCELSNQTEVAKNEKGTRQQVRPTTDPDPRTLGVAVDQGDYAAFRQSLLGYDEPVRQRVGRWIQRYPEAEAQLGGRLQLADIVDEVFLNAFDRYAERPAGLALSEWLESLIDPSVRALLDHPDEEKENIEFARTASETATPE
jgi:hypothetical protein